MSFTDDAKNKAQDLKGRAKETAGTAFDDPQLKEEGRGDQAEASIKDKIAGAADKVKEGVDEVKDKLSGN
ncbi:MULTISPECIES: CsbD family protein [Tsukamurella]|uniref:CsbD family protein n=2 Tax=Tsukamurella TaxID=2060 RepID=A0A5C5S589_9ACTN|nr:MULTISPECIES: CsbD family protein [Tsukamurella]NMD55236.1 CsbD family protein [Tsukamurella columbiensis]TWS30254.1 CsbD family protein [Tsukamurella conjunctivitidis]